MKFTVGGVSTEPCLFGHSSATPLKPCEEACVCGEARVVRWRVRKFLGGQVLEGRKSP